MMDFKNKPIQNFQGKKVAVVGLGVEGLSSAKFLKNHGADVTVLDRNKINSINYISIYRTKTGKDYLNDLNHFDLIIRSPGVKLSLMNKVPKGKITSQIKLFFEECPCPIIGVTGTKGKGTTASLIYGMLKKQGLDAYLGGNIGKPPFDFLDKLSPHSIVVIELSSFQLQDLTKSPHIAVMLMTTSEHLDYHKDTKEYVDAKRNILRFQNSSDFAIVNRDYPASNESDIFTEGKVFYISTKREGKEGCFVKNEKIYYRYTGISSVKDVEIISTKDILLPGKHNLENVCAAVMAATLSGVSKENIAKVLKTFKGLEHRLELVRVHNGVKYYDDSFSTTPETAIAAIEAFKNPEILILGGSSKGSDFTELGQAISSHDNMKAIIGIGIEWPRIKRSIKYQVASIMYIEGAEDMKTIITAASKIAIKGDVVLLSPACASFDMFKNYKDRGEKFKKEVKRLS